MKENSKQKRTRFYLFLAAGFAMLWYFLPNKDNLWNTRIIIKAIFESFGFSFVIFYLSFWVSNFIDKKLQKNNS